MRSFLNVSHSLLTVNYIIWILRFLLFQMTILCSAQRIRNCYYYCTHLSHSIDFLFLFLFRFRFLFLSFFFCLFYYSLKPCFVAAAVVVVVVDFGGDAIVVVQDYPGSL